MMTEKQKDNLDTLLHNMSNVDLQAHINKTKFTKIVCEAPEEEPILEEDLLLHSMSATELKALFDKSKPINLNNNQQEISPKKVLKAKAAKTGLSKKAIKKIETNKQKATLEEIIAYCKGLQINFKDFLPELFSPSN